MKDRSTIARKADALLAPVKLLLLIAAAAALQACEAGVYTGSCQANDEIPEKTRNEIEAAAIRYVGLMKLSSKQAASLLSSRGKLDIKPEAIEAGLVGYRNFKMTSEPVIATIYSVTTSSTSRVSASVPCGTENGRMVFVPRGGTLINALVLITEDILGNSKITDTLWMEYEDGKWLVRGIVYGVSTISGLDSEQLWNLAKEQRQKERTINAAVLYSAARDTLDRGPFFQPPLKQDFAADLQTFEAPRNLAFTFGKETFSVTTIRYIGLRTGQLALGLDHAVAAGASKEEVEAINRRLIDGFDAAHPEWREVFGALVALARDAKSQQAQETVFSRESGYLNSATP